MKSDKRKKCPACFGSGIQHNDKTGLRETCPVCFGSGEVLESFGRDEFPWDVYY